MSNQEHVLDLIPAYAMDCLDPDEAVQMADHLIACASCRRELQAYEAVVTQLALAVPQVAPGAELKKRLLAQIEPSADTGSLAPAAAKQLWWLSIIKTLRGGAFWRPAVAFLIVLLLASNIFLWQQLNRSTASPNGFHYISLQPTEINPNARGMIVVNHSGHSGTLIVDGLPALEEKLQYQLWLLQNGDREDGGVFSVYRNGYFALLIHATAPLDQYTAFGITIEPAGGSPGPTGAKVLGGNRQ